MSSTVGALIVVGALVGITHIKQAIIQDGSTVGTIHNESILLDDLLVDYLLSMAVNQFFNLH